MVFIVTFISSNDQLNKYNHLISVGKSAFLKAKWPPYYVTHAFNSDIIFIQDSITDQSLFDNAIFNVIIAFCQNIDQIFFIFAIKQSTMLSILIGCLMVGAYSFSSADPVWLTSPYMRAGNQAVISTLTGQSYDPIYTFTFSKALPGIPNLAYGIKNYRGNDYMGVEQFQVRRLDLTAATFKVQVDIIGTTNIWIFNVPYIAVDPTFPHHLNSFDNVPINYGTTLTNVTVNQTAQTSFTNVVNYTDQAKGRNYTTFAEPLSSNKILLYICAFHIWATFASSGKNFPIDLNVWYNIETTTTYRMSMTLSTKVVIAKIQFSQIIINTDDVQSSKKYFIVYQTWKTAGTGGFFSIPRQFQDNFIMGLTDFSSIDGRCGFQYQWQFQTSGDQFGVQILNSITKNGFCGFSKMTSTIFYMMTWQCPQVYPYFNLTTNSCQDECGYYFYQNTTILQCQSCPLGCTKCKNSLMCTQCNFNWDKRVLVQIDYVSYCNCADGFYDDYANTACVPCSNKLTNCLTCFYDPEYSSTSAKIEYGCTKCQSTHFLDPNSKKCVNFISCDASKLVYLNISNNVCQRCSLKACKTCSTLYACSNCDAQQNYFLNQSTKLCRYCDYLPGCILCASNSTCKTCNQTFGYFFNKQSSSCVYCSVGCQRCNEESQFKCTQCSETFTLQYGQCRCKFGTYLDQMELQCKPCSPICQSCVGPTQYECQRCSPGQNRISKIQKNGLMACICNPFNYMQAENGSNVCVKKHKKACDLGYIFVNTLDKCVQICGDGLVLTQNECDDGNLVSGDGCSKFCKVQQDFQCSNDNMQPSICVFIGQIDIVDAKAYKDPFGNFITIYCELDPIKQFFYEINWKDGLQLIGPKLLVQDSWMEEKNLVINMSYYQNLNGKTLTIKYSSKNRSTQKSPRLLFASAFDFDFTLRDYNLPIEPVNNLSPVFLEDSAYNYSRVTSSIAVILSVICCCIILGAFFLKTSFSMFQIILSLQLVLLSLGTITNMHPIMLSITEFSPIKGLRSTNIYFKDLVSPNEILDYNIQVLGYVTSFFGNMNIMIFIQFALILTTSALYLMSKKDLSFKNAAQFARRELMLIVVFTSLNLIMSLGLFNSFYPFEVITAICAFGIMAAQIVHFIRYFRKYYFFDTIFDPRNEKVKKYLVTFFICKLLCALFISVLRRHTVASSALVLIIQIFFAVVFTIIRPYIRKFMNILNICAQWTVVLFMFINLLVNFNIFGQADGYTTMSLVQVSLSYLIFFLAFFSFFYSFYIDYCVKSKVAARIKLDQISPRKSKVVKKQKQQLDLIKEKVLDVNIEDLSDYDGTMAVSHQTINLDILAPDRKRGHK